MTSLTRARRRTAALLALASSGLVLSGCSLWAPNTVLQPYAPADGLQAELGNLLVRNMLVVSEGDGEAGVLVGALVNGGPEDITAELEVGGTAVEVEVPAGASVAFGTERVRPDTEASQIIAERVEIESVDPIAGDVLDLSVSNPEAGAVVLRVPIYPPEGVYAEFTPGD